MKLWPPKTVAVILAAGSGSRFTGGGHKLNAIEANIGSVIVVTGAVDLQIGELAVRILHNPLWQTGLASSLQVGIAVAREQSAEAVVVGLGDQPFVPASAWRAVANSLSPIAVATYRARRGNPVRLHAEIWPALPTAGDDGARSVFQMYNNLVEEVPCEGSSSDIDTLEDLERMNNEVGKNY